MRTTDPLRALDHHCHLSSPSPDTQNSASSKVKLESPANDESFAPTKCWVCTRNSLGCDIMVNRNHVAPVCVKLGRAGSCGTLFSRTSASVKTVYLKMLYLLLIKDKTRGTFLLLTCNLFLAALGFHCGAQALCCCVRAFSN